MIKERVPTELCELAQRIVKRLNNFNNWCDEDIMKMCLIGVELNEILFELKLMTSGYYTLDGISEYMSKSETRDNYLKLFKELMNERYESKVIKENKNEERSSSSASK